MLYLSDPYARVAFANQSQVTYTVTQSPCPTWDQTLLFTSVEICEDPENVKRNPPSVVVELYDYDKGLVRQDWRTERISHCPTKKTTTIKQNQTETKKKKKKEERKRTHDYLLMDSQRTCGRIEKSLDMFGLSTPGNRKLIES